MIKIKNVHDFLDYLTEANYIYFIRDGFVEIVTESHTLFVY